MTTPINEIIIELATAKPLPNLAVGACLLRMDEAGPPLRALVEKAAAGGTLDDSEETLLFRGLHILGGARDAAACGALLRLLRRPADEVEWLLGDAITETLPRIIAGVFDGDATALFDLVVDCDADSFVREAVLRATVFLTWTGRIDRAAMIDLLERIDDEDLADEEDIIWRGWQEAIALLGLRSLADRVHRAFEDERIDETLCDVDDFTKDLAAAERAPDDIGRLLDTGLGYIDDVAVDLMRFPDDGDDGAAADVDDPYDLDSPPLTAEPVINPWRHVGRNDPCPCGSGKKFKKCCLGA